MAKKEGKSKSRTRNRKAELEIPKDLSERALQSIQGYIQLIQPCGSQTAGTDVELFAVALEKVSLPDDTWVFELALSSKNVQSGDIVCKTLNLSFLAPGSQISPLKLSGYHLNAQNGGYEVTATLAARKLIGGPTIQLDMRTCRYSVS
ncbi:MAG: hypothetical protein KDA93_01525 [Planctomycetaceae bacterium]|nr:hypothetical protein [Planctomycetaceae bacterium]